MQQVSIFWFTNTCICNDPGPFNSWLCLHRVVVKLRVESGYFACPTRKGCLCNYSFYYKSTSQTCYGDLYPILKTVHTKKEKMVHDFKNQVKDCIIWLAKWSVFQQAWCQQLSSNIWQAPHLVSSSILACGSFKPPKAVHSPSLSVLWSIWDTLVWHNWLGSSVGEIWEVAIDIQSTWHWLVCWLLLLFNSMNYPFIILRKACD